MYDTVRWVLLVILFIGLFALWLWARRQASLKGSPLGAPGTGFKILQKRWVDQKTGVCLVETQGQTYMLAYTVGGGVSWQVVDKKAPAPEEPAIHWDAKDVFPEAGRR